MDYTVFTAGTAFLGTQRIVQLGYSCVYFRRRRAWRKVNLLFRRNNAVKLPGRMFRVMRVFGLAR